MATDVIANWSANAPAEQITGYKVIWDNAVVATVTNTTYTIRSVTTGPHELKVRAVNSLTEGPDSDPLAVNVPALPSKVTNVTATISFTLSS